MSCLASRHVMNQRERRVLQGRKNVCFERKVYEGTGHSHCPCLGHTLLMRAAKRTQEQPLMKGKVTVGHRGKKRIGREVAGPFLVISLSLAQFASRLWGTNLRQRHPLFRPPYMGPGW